MKTLRKIKAFLLRTFVTDCPVCHKHFYGYHDYAQNIKINHKHFRIICHRCAEGANYKPTIIEKLENEHAWLYLLVVIEGMALIWLTLKIY